MTTYFKGAVIKHPAYVKLENEFDDLTSTTLAIKLGEALNVPVVSLDSVVWKKGWVPASKEERAIGEQSVIVGEHWVIEGVSKTVRESADYIIFLDVPRSVCMSRCFKRNFLYFFKSRSELPENCPEILIVPQLLKIIWNFPIIAKPIILESLERKKGVVISDLNQIDDLVAKIVIEHGFGGK